MHFFNLPVELQFKIFEYCDTKTLARSARTNKQWYSLSNDNSLWQKKLTELAGCELKKAASYKYSWKTAYKKTSFELRYYAEWIYELLYAKKPDNVDYSSDYTTTYIQEILEIYKQAISPQALTKTLLNNYSDILVREDNHHHTILHWLAACGLYEAFEVVLIKAESEQTRIYTLAEEGYRLIDSRNIDGLTPIHFGLIHCPKRQHNGLVEVVDLCLQYFADLTVCDAFEGINFQQELDEYWEYGWIHNTKYKRICELINSRCADDSLRSSLNIS